MKHILTILVAMLALGSYASENINTFITELVTATC